VNESGQGRPRPEEKDNANNWNKTTAFYDAATIDPEELGQDTSVVLNKGQFDASRAARQEHGRDNRLAPGWTGTSITAEVRDNLDRVSESLRNESASLSNID
jgi:hypothetical protein